MTELRHYGVLGMKWGVRRYQNEDGSLTAAGRERYGVDKNVGNFLLGGSSVGQRILATSTKGYKQDKKAIKELRKKKEQEIRESGADRKSKKESLKELKGDYKKTLGEARTAAAQARFYWQSADMNKKIQAEGWGKALAKNLLLGGVGSRKYNELSSAGVSKGYALAEAMREQHILNEARQASRYRSQQRREQQQERRKRALDSAMGRDHKNT